MIEFPRTVHASSDRGVVPFITQRKGEEAAPADLTILRQQNGKGPRLFYVDESFRDRPVRGILWARCSFSMGKHGMPTGEPEWKLMHPYRQMVTMLAGRCQICTRPARTPLGFVFLAGPKDEDPTQPSILTNQPPVCARHIRTAAKLCPHMEENPMVFLAGGAPLYGAMGSVYDFVFGGHGDVEVVSRPAEPVPFGDPRAPLLLASQLVRRLSSFRVLGLDEVLAKLAAAA
ncbi:hypothetical protein DIZ27_32955 [Streptomyces sp. NWU339]|uniref:hypothetical protein n=1 Tax=Streptomyces sp. NWU339 TaxID=2185284 RepID=UPI000D673D58|nr:hypothetical protein [Streptomyces sp. NWU339]PWI06548.1 hypothetical protein DIZ27_32955 [Streptomyces sp. NWU339]